MISLFSSVAEFDVVDLDLAGRLRCELECDRFDLRVKSTFCVPRISIQ